MIDALSFLIVIVLSVGFSHVFFAYDFRNRIFWIVIPGIFLLFIIQPLALAFAMVCWTLSLVIFLLGKAATNTRVKARIPYAILLLLFLPDVASLASKEPILWLGSAFFIVRQMMTVTQGIKHDVHLRRFLPSLLLSTFFFASLPSGPVFNGLQAWDLLKRNATPSYRDGSYRLFEGFVYLFAFAGFSTMSIAAAQSAESMLTGSAGFAGVLLLRLVVEPLAGFAFLFTTFYGYSRMAEGSALLLGFEVPQNFNKPHLARDLGDFWKRWHRSMADFVMQYIYLPLLVTTSKTKFALISAFVFMGLWHNFSLAFLIWGVGHGVGLAYLLPWARTRNYSPTTIRIASLTYVVALSAIAHGIWTL